MGWVYRLIENFFDNRVLEFFNICYNNEDLLCVLLNKRIYFMDMLWIICYMYLCILYFFVVVKYIFIYYILKYRFELKIINLSM